MRALDEQPRSIAYVRLRVGLGDLLCTVPALRALRARLPGAHVALVTWTEVAPVVERMRPWVDELVAFPGYPGIPERDPEHDAIAPFLAAMRDREWDLAVAAYGANPAANAVTERFGARRTAGFVVPGTWPCDLATHLPYPHHRHEIDRHLDLIAHLGAPPAGRELEFPVTAADEREAAELRARAGLYDGAAYAVVHPGATSSSRRWGAVRFAAVADGLAARGLRVVLGGVADEAPLTAAVAAAMDHPVVDLAGRTSLGGYAALLRGARVLVAADTGAAHLAAALGVRSVTVFLSGDPVRWRHDEARHAVARVQVECNPCPHLTCPIDHRCATRLTPRAVLARVGAVLEPVAA